MDIPRGMKRARPQCCRTRAGARGRHLPVTGAVKGPHPGVGRDLAPGSVERSSLTGGAGEIVSRDWLTADVPQSGRRREGTGLR